MVRRRNSIEYPIFQSPVIIELDRAAEEDGIPTVIVERDFVIQPQPVTEWPIVDWLRSPLDADLSRLHEMQRDMNRTIITAFHDQTIAPEPLTTERLREALLMLNAVHTDWQPRFPNALVGIVSDGPTPEEERAYQAFLAAELPPAQSTDMADVLARTRSRFSRISGLEREGFLSPDEIVNSLMATEEPE